jgi:hypothetical protein
MNKRNAFYALALLLCGLMGCAGFAMNFSGGRLDPNRYKRMAIANFLHEAPEGPANLGLLFTEKLREYYQRNTPLELVLAEADVELEGSIAAYQVTPVSPSGDQFAQGAQQQRLTITVRVSYIDNVDEAKSFDSPFSFQQDFPADQNLADVEEELIELIFDQIVFEIFNRTYADW